MLAGLLEQTLAEEIQHSTEIVEWDFESNLDCVGHPAQMGYWAH